MCIADSHRDWLLNASKWPDSVTISEWYYIPPSDERRQRTVTSVHIDNVSVQKNDALATERMSSESVAASSTQASSTPAVPPDDLTAGDDMDQDNKDITVLYHNAASQSKSAVHPTALSTTSGISNTNHSLTSMSYNLHGLNQGRSTVQEFENHVDIFVLQGHWQTPANMHKFSRLFPSHCAIGISALTEHVQAGPLIGRPYGGVVTLIRNELQSESECLYTAERLVTVRISDILL